MFRLRVGDRNLNTLINGLAFYVVLRVSFLCFVLIGFQHFVFCRLCLSFGSVFMSINQVLIYKSFHFLVICHKLFFEKDVNWGQTSDSQLYKTALSAAYKLNIKSDHVKSYRPSILLLSGVPNNHMPLISLANEITRHRGMLIVCDIVNNNLIYEIRYKTIELWNNWLNKHKIKGFYTLLNSDSISEGSKMLIQVCIRLKSSEQIKCFSL